MFCNVCEIVKYIIYYCVYIRYLVRVATNQQKLLFRECDPKTMTISNIGCTICKKEFDSKVAIRKHLHCHICFTNPCKTLEEA